MKNSNNIHDLGDEYGYNQLLNEHNTNSNIITNSSTISITTNKSILNSNNIDLYPTTSKTSTTISRSSKTLKTLKTLNALKPSKTLNTSKTSKTFETRDDTSNNVLSNKIPNLFKRCVTCNDTDLSCPTCSAGQSCVMISQTCDSCAKVYCQADSAVTSTNTSVVTSTASEGYNKSTNIGAIIGGVIGGVAVITLIICFFIWRHYRLRKKIEKGEVTIDVQDTNINGNSNTIGNLGKLERGELVQIRASHGMGQKNEIVNKRNTEEEIDEGDISRDTTTSTILSHASNILPIAYIPGVTIRPDSSFTATNSNLNNDISTSGLKSPGVDSFISRDSVNTNFSSDFDYITVDKNNNTTTVDKPVYSNAKATIKVVQVSDGSSQHPNPIKVVRIGKSKGSSNARTHEIIEEENEDMEIDEIEGPNTSTPLQDIEEEEEEKFKGKGKDKV